MKWSGEPLIEEEVRERAFTIECEGRNVPGILWTPTQPAPASPVVLLGHGGTLHKRAHYILATARRLVRQHGMAAVSIDGPGHGERKERIPEDQDQARADFVSAWLKPGANEKIVADWTATLDAAQAEVGEGPVGYFGLSMGTMMGIPLIAAEPRIQAAVLGLMGVWGPNRDRLVEDAPKIACPIRFLAQWNDEVVPRETVLDLFDRLGSSEKSLRAHPGRHVQVPAPEMRAIADFFASHLK
ncbi:MAG: dienelactone hydrolase family protein [Myxococcota bacterium]|nr:dienelactone hydrolase family protein [Myxococcota bacterium]